MENGMNYLWFQHQGNMQGGDGLYSRMSGNQMFRESIDPELDHKTRRVSDKFSENINTIANEPSLAFFRIQEHVRKTLPQLVEQKHEVQNIQTRVQGACFDTEYATNAVKTMYQSEFHFQNIQELLKNAMFMKQQIGYEESRRRSPSEASVSSSPRSSASPLASSPSARPIREPSAFSGPPSAFSGPPSASSGSPSAVLGPPSASVGPPSASLGPALASSGSPSAVANPGPDLMSADTSAPAPPSVPGDGDEEGPRAPAAAAAGTVDADVRGQVTVIHPGPSALSLNCDSDDIDVAAEVGEDDDIS